MSDNTVTITGRVGTAPRLREAGNGQPVTEFRLARTPRYQDRGSGEWVDGRTMWVTVTCWRALARNVSQSVGVGDPVMVQGRLVYDQWDAADGTRRSAVKVVAEAVGFDLSIGIAEFHKIRWSGSGPTRDGENAGAPSEESAQERSPWPAVWVDGDGEDPDLPEAASDHRPRGPARHVPGDGVGDDPSGVPADPVPQTASV